MVFMSQIVFDIMTKLIKGTELKLARSVLIGQPQLSYSLRKFGENWPFHKGFCLSAIFL